MNNDLLAVGIMKTDRRQNARYRVSDTVYAALGRNYSKFGQIINISSGGLAFEYISGEVPDQNASIIDIFTENSVFGLYHFPCSLVYDNIIKRPGIKNQSVDLLTYRRCGVKFGRMNKEKENRLSKLLSVHAADFAE